MNERIEKLIDDAKLTAVSEMFEADLKKFAELIVNDIIEIMSDPINYNRCTFTTFDESQAKCVASELAIKINQHFGTKL